MKKLMSLLLAGLLLATAAATAAAPYANNRAPLREKPFVKLPLGAIRAEGWLRDQLQRQADGQRVKLLGPCGAGPAIRRDRTGKAVRVLPIQRQRRRIGQQNLGFMFGRT